jgi:hypothetical protein
MGAGPRCRVGTDDAMNIAQRFRAVLADIPETPSREFELLPARLAMGCARVLAVDGAGISLTDELRLPLGASDQQTAEAERLQATVGEGPCLSAHHSGMAVAAELDEIANTWPVFHDLLITHTAFRSVASVPLQTSTSRIGALDLYSTGAKKISAVPLDQAGELAQLVTLTLLIAPEAPTSNGDPGPSWLQAPAALDRMQVWKAIGLLNAEQGMEASAALSVLRSYAYANQTTLDHVAGELVNGGLEATDITP